MSGLTGSTFVPGLPIGTVGSGGLAFSTQIHNFGAPIGFVSGTTVYSTGMNDYGTVIGSVAGR